MYGLGEIKSINAWRTELYRKAQTDKQARADKAKRVAESQARAKDSARRV